MYKLESMTMYQDEMEVGLTIRMKDAVTGETITRSLELPPNAPATQVAFAFEKLARKLRSIAR